MTPPFCSPCTLRLDHFDTRMNELMINILPRQHQWKTELRTETIVLHLLRYRLSVNLSDTHIRSEPLYMFSD